MSKSAPDHHDAELVLKIYDLRREAVMRESRDAINREFWPKTADDAVAITKPEHSLNRQYRQTASYWEMVYGFARQGAVHPELLMESNGEGLLLFARIEPHLAAIRAATSPRAFRNAEWVATNTEIGRAQMETFRGRIAKMLATR